MISLTDQAELAQFAAGVASAVVVLLALLQVTAFAKGVLCVAAVALGYVLYAEGVPGVMAYASAGVGHLAQYEAFAHGLLIGKLVAALAQWGHVRARRGGPR